MKSSDIPSLIAIPLPFAFYGETKVASPKLDPFTDPAEEAEGKNFFDSRWVWDSSTTPATPPSRVITRQLMNRLFAQISGRQFMRQCGALDTFDENVCKAIGGYPRGAVLQYLDENVLYDVVSMRDDNDTDYTKVGIDGINWNIYGSSVFTYVYPDYGSVGQDNILKRWRIDNLNVQVSSDALSITSPCWIEAFLTEPLVSSGYTNYECGIILYGGNTSAPSSIPAYNNASYTVRELTEGGTISIEVLPVLPGDRITAFANQNSDFPCDIVIRKLTPTRTR